MAICHMTNLTMVICHVADQDLTNNVMSNDDTWDVKITLQHVTYDHGSRRLLVKKPSQKT
jgi:hypothetical protein